MVIELRFWRVLVIVASLIQIQIRYVEPLGQYIKPCLTFTLPFIYVRRFCFYSTMAKPKQKVMFLEVNECVFVFTYLYCFSALSYSYDFKE